MHLLIRQISGLLLGVAITVAAITVADAFAQDGPTPAAPPALEVNTLSADAALTIHYQGQLFDPNTNAPRVNTPFTAVFRLYSESAGGLLLWNETKGLATNVDGIFNTRLGDTTPFPNPIDLFNGRALWLEIVLDGEVTAPRQPINYTPYAFWSRTSGFSANSAAVGGIGVRDLPRVVAFGVVNDNGNRASGRDFESSYATISGEPVYIIDLPVNHSINDYTTIITPACNRAVHFGVGTSNQGELLVDMWDTAGNRTQCRFEFMVLARQN